MIKNIMWCKTNMEENIYYSLKKDMDLMLWI